MRALTCCVLASFSLLAGCRQVGPSDEAIDRFGQRVEAIEGSRIRQEILRDKTDYGFSAVSEAEAVAHRTSKSGSPWATDKKTH